MSHVWMCHVTYVNEYDAALEREKERKRERNRLCMCVRMYVCACVCVGCVSMALYQSLPPNNFQGLFCKRDLTSDRACTLRRPPMCMGDWSNHTSE